MPSRSVARRRFTPGLPWSTGLGPVPDPPGAGMCWLSTHASLSSAAASSGMPQQRTKWTQFRAVRPRTHLRPPVGLVSSAGTRGSITVPSAPDTRHTAVHTCSPKPCAPRCSNPRRRRATFLLHERRRFVEESLRRCGPSHAKIPWEAAQDVDPSRLRIQPQQAHPMRSSNRLPGHTLEPSSGCPRNAAPPGAPRSRCGSYSCDLKLRRTRCCRSGPTAKPGPIRSNPRGG